MNISDKQAIIDQLRKLDIRPSKDRGQNFLFDSGALSEIIIFGKPKDSERILEIGPGLGALTAELIGSAEFVVVEIEDKFAAYLAEKYPGINIINQDIVSFDFDKIGLGWTVFGNLPYSLSTDIMLFLVKNRTYIKRAVVLLQKEFAERIFAVPGTKDYGSLTLQVQLHADVFPGPLIPGDSFYPEASVTSQVIELVFFEQPKHKIKCVDTFDRLVRAAFSQRRKKLVNSIKSANKFPAETIDQALQEAAIDPGIRAEQLPIDQFVLLANTLADLSSQES